LQEASNLTGKASDWNKVQGNPATPYTAQIGTIGRKFYRLVGP